MKIKRSKDEVILKEKDLKLLGETMVTMGADLFQTLYDMSDEMDYAMVENVLELVEGDKE